ncbi:MFS transporter [Cellvibrio mixtus]|uniref:MFS transporter n=1 Tax=Cellvibrio mixtus TaxID=39650 RepID=UPI000588030B|nr:glycoside-pentoside-hexuronide (GPH):cation symporter [Cellvibrio mixtus]
MASDHQLKKTEIVAYGAGDAAFALIGTLLGFYQLYFLTDVFGIAPASIAIIMLVIKIWDTVNHPLMGILADRTQSKYGRYRPWLLYSILPLAISSILVFYAPPGLSDWQKNVYALSVCFIYWSSFSAVNVPYVALMSAMTSNVSSRANLASARFIGAFGASTLAMFFTKDLVLWFGDGDEASGFLAVSILYAIIGSVILYWTFYSTQERISVQPESILTPWGDIKSLFRSGPFWTVIATSVFIGLFVSVKSGLAVFYLKYVIQIPSVDKYFMAGGTISCLIGVCFVSLLLGKFDKKRLFICFMSGNALFIAAIFWVDPENTALLLTFHFLNSFLGGACAPIFFAIYSDVIDYNEFKTGSRSAALINSLGLFAGTLGAAIGGFIAPIGLAWIGYTANQPQNANVIEGLCWLFTIVPAVFASIAALLMVIFPLNKSRMASINYRLSQRRVCIDTH